MAKPVIIIGGGVIGLCCAYFLQKKGYEIIIIDRGDITQGTSFGNAGYVSPSHFIPLASPGIVAKGLRWMLSSSSPFYIKPRLNTDLIRWALNFWKNATHDTVSKNAPHLNNILQLSRELTSEIKNELGNSFRMEEKGCFMLFKTEATEKHEIELAKEANRFNIEARILSAKEVQDMEPEVEVNVKGGILYPIDAHLHPGEFMGTLKKSLEASGVKFVTNSAVTGFDHSNNFVTAVVTNNEKYHCSEVIIANGSWLPITLKQLGIQLLLQAGKGYSITFPNIERNLHYPAILIDYRVAMTPMGGDLRMGGTMEISGINNTILTKRVQAIFNAAKSCYPDLPVTFPSKEKIWHGLRPLTPDGLPYIGRHSKFKNMVIAGGHAMLGLSLAAGTGKLVEEMISNRPTSINTSAFDVERFG